MMNTWLNWSQPDSLASLEPVAPPLDRRTVLLKLLLRMLAPREQPTSIFQLKRLHSFDCETGRFLGPKSVCFLNSREERSDPERLRWRYGRYVLSQLLAFQRS
jgi:hypothetical protein